MKLTDRKSRLIFETRAKVWEQGQYREIIVEATPHDAMLRLKRKHHWVKVPWGTVFIMAARLAADAAKAERKKKKSLK